MTCEHEAELTFYRDLLGAVSYLYECSKALDTAPSNPEDERTVEAWSNYWGAAEEVFDFVRAEQHAAAMEAAGVTCNELAHSSVVLSA